MKAYTISFYQQEVSDDELVAYLETKREVLNLMKLLPNMALIVSDRNASLITRLIEKNSHKVFSLWQSIFHTIRMGHYRKKHGISLISLKSRGK
jgi:hypothetical protein